MSNHYTITNARLGRGFSRGALALALLAGVASGVAMAGAPDPTKLVVCAPGAPGTTDDAQPAMTAFAAALGDKAGVALTAVYDPAEASGIARLKAAGVGLVSLPFFLAHERDLGLHARLEVVQKGRPALEHWALVAQQGRVRTADALAGMTVASNAAFAPAFVRGDVLGALAGALPADVKLQQSSAVLSALRKAANGEPIAVVLDGPGETQLASLPFAAKLEVVARSQPMPAGIVVTIDARMPAATWAKLESALLGMGADKSAQAALDGVQMTGFQLLDGKALDAARAAYAKAGS